MANLNQVIVIFHRLIVPAEKMAQKEAMIFLSVKALVFNLPAAASEKDCFPCVSVAQRQVRQENKRIRLAVLRVFQTVELMAFIINVADEIIPVRYVSVRSFFPVSAQFA